MLVVESFLNDFGFWSYIIGHIHTHTQIPMSVAIGIKKIKYIQRQANDEY